MRHSGGGAADRVVDQRRLSESENIAVTEPVLETLQLDDIPTSACV